VVGVQFKEISWWRSPPSGIDALDQRPQPGRRGGDDQTPPGATAKRKIPIRYETKAIELLTNTKLEITGVRALADEGLIDFKGQRRGYPSPTGGFHANKEMVSAWSAAVAVHVDVLRPKWLRKYLAGDDISSRRTQLPVRPADPAILGRDHFLVGMKARRCG